MSAKKSSPHSDFTSHRAPRITDTYSSCQRFHTTTIKKATSTVLLLAILFSLTSTHIIAKTSSNKQKRGNQLAATVLKVNSFDAVGDRSVRVLRWATEAEVNHLGFNLYRDDNGTRTQVNEQLITNTVLSLTTEAALPAAHTYEFLDSATSNEVVSYWLESIDVKGNSRWLGPYSSRLSAEKFAGHDTLNVRAVASTSAGQSVPVESRAKLVKPSLLFAKVKGTGNPAKALKVSVNAEGWYRLTQAELLAAGLNSSIDPRTLQLYAGGKAQQMVVKGEEDGRFDPSDYVEFYGQGIDSTYSKSNIYWLMEGTGFAQRVATAPAMNHQGGGGSFPYSVERRDKSIYFSSLLNGDLDNFFGAVIVREPLHQTLTVRNLDTEKVHDTTLRIALQGVNWYDHVIDVQANGQYLGQLYFFGQFPGEISFTVPHTVWREGDNVITLTPLGGLTDISLVDSITLTYEHTFTADNNYLRFPLKSNQPVTIWGFSSDAISVFDVTSPQAVRRLNGQLVKREGKNGATDFGISLSLHGSGVKELMALTENRYSRVAKINVDSPSNWKATSNRADFVIFTTKSFFPMAEELQALRKNEGISTAIVDIEDVYDEFSFGQKTPQAIKDFLANAMSNWSQPVKYILFLGDSSYDPKNYLNHGDTDLVPTKLADTIFLEAVTDDWFADFNGDFISDIPVGRLPARNQQEAQTMINKIVAYENAAPSNEVLLVADTNDVYDFESANNNLIPLLPADSNITFVKRSQLGDSGARSAILDSLNRGPKIVNYAGHGSIDLWRGNLLTNSDAMHLQNQHSLPMVVTMNCLNGYFQDPLLEGLSESLLKSPQGGAVAAWGSSSLTFAEEQAPANYELFRLLFDNSKGGLTIGEAAIRAKSMTYDIDVRYSWILFGDPTMRLK
jgi:hypothetical protein